MIKKLVLVIIALFAIQSYAQQGTASPYSFYGIGSLKFKGTVENRSMGGLSIYTDSIHVNLRNPASYATPNINALGFDGESRPVKFSVGGGQTSLKLKSATSNDKASSTTLDYIALSIPLRKFGFGFGLMPYTSVGYKLETLNDAGNLLNKFKGQGGLNKVYFALAYSISKELSVGVNADYNFGNIQNSTVEYVYDLDGVPLLYQSRENNRSDLSGLNFTLGLSYKKMLGNKYELVTGLTYIPKSNLTSDNQRSFSTISISSSTGQEFALNTVETDLASLGLQQTKLTMPSKFSIGAGIGQPRKWFIGTEYSGQKTSEFYNPLYSSFTTTYENSSRVSVGGFFIPQYNSFTGYFKRVVYRAGLRFEKTGLVINNQSIKEFGMSFGLGLPVGNVFSNANLGFEIGKRGTTNSNLIQENFINFQLSLSLNDRWFQKRKYD